MTGKKVTVLSHQQTSSIQPTSKNLTEQARSENATPVPQPLLSKVNCTKPAAPTTPVITEAAPSVITRATSPPRETLLPASPKMRECDYDTRPTDIYQAIEAKQWDYIVRMLEGEDDEKLNIPSPSSITMELPPSKQASTWVVRKEQNGKLRWRLLPIHAAIIFQAPYEVIEILLDVYPAGASAKDDQGMLPLHLSMRNKPCNFRIVEELLSANPGAVFVKDRKGRTPIASGIAAMSEKDPACTATLSTLSLYTQISTAGEKQAMVAEHDNLLRERLALQQAQHDEEMKKLESQFEKEKQRLQANLASERQTWQESLETTRNDLTEERNRNQVLTSQLEASSTSQGFDERELELRTENQQMKIMCQRLLEQQSLMTTSMQHLMWEQEQLNKKRQELLHDYCIMGEAEENATRCAVTKWKHELDSTHTSVSESLSRLLTIGDVKLVESCSSDGSEENPLQVEPDMQSRNESYYCSKSLQNDEMEYGDGEFTDEKKCLSASEKMEDRVSLSRSSDREVFYGSREDP